MVLPEYRKPYGIGATEVLDDSPPSSTNFSQAGIGTRTRFLEVKSPIIRRFVFASVLLLSALYAGSGLKRGWFPWDEGEIAQSAESVLNGELPHRDFPENYTGGLDYLNALSFRMFGTNLASMRYMLFLFFLLWVPAFYYSARHFVSSPVAGAVTLLAVAWSIPNYSAPMPSWYNLFFGTFGLAALLRYVDIPRSRWLFIAGLCGGISCLFKISGLYFVAGVLLFLLFREAAIRGLEEESRRETALFRIFLISTVLVYETLVLLVLRKAANVATYPYFWAPNLAVGAGILWLEFHRVKPRGRRFFFLFRELAPFTVGLVLPIATFLIPYVLAANVFEVSQGISDSVQAHLQNVFGPPSVMKLIVGITVNLALGLVAFVTATRIAKVVGILFFAAIPVVIFLARAHPYVDRAVWSTIWSFLPFVVVIGTLVLTFSSMRGRLAATEQQKTFLVLSVCATTNLIQFPYSGASYYCYVVPFAFLSATALVSQVKTPPKLVLTAALCFCFFYIALVVTPSFVINMGQQYSPDQQTVRLDIPRAGGLRVSPYFASTYNPLSVVIKQHVRGQYTFAAPNCPEVYFLNGLRDATATLFRANYDPSEGTKVVMAALLEHNVNLIVLKDEDVPFTAAVPPNLRAALEREFPNRAIVGPFEVRWKS